LLKRRRALAALSVGLALAAPAAAQAATCTGWTVTKTLPAGSSLHKVSTLNGNAWAIGTSPTGPLIMRFDGSRWTETPRPGTDELAAHHPEVRDIHGYQLEGVFARSATDAWAVGYASGMTSGVELVQFAVAMRWDGTAWRFVPTPRAGETEAFTLRGVVAFGPDDAWAVGSYHSPDSGKLPLAMHWDGTSWTADAQVWPRAYDSRGALYAAARTPYAQTLWAVGEDASWDELTGTSWQGG
jgi:hypothetical protein